MQRVGTCLRVKMPSLLFTDDNSELVEIHSTYLQEQGYHVETACDGEVALEVLKKTPIDLLVTDVVMPGREGLETISTVREIYPNLRIIAISGCLLYTSPSPRDRG